MLQNFQEMKVNKSLKIHMMLSHLDFFPENMGAVSDEQTEITIIDMVLRFCPKSKGRKFEEMIEISSIY